MAEPASFAESNDYLGPPPGVGEEDCQSLAIGRAVLPNGQAVVISCWKLTAEELEEVNRTGRVWLSVWGHTMPPAVICGKKPFYEG